MRENHLSPSPRAVAERRQKTSVAGGGWWEGAPPHLACPLPATPAGVSFPLSPHEHLDSSRDCQAWTWGGRVEMEPPHVMGPAWPSSPHFSPHSSAFGVAAMSLPCSRPWVGEGTELPCHVGLAWPSYPCWGLQGSRTRPARQVGSISSPPLPALDAAASAAEKMLAWGIGRELPPSTIMQAQTGSLKTSAGVVW